MWLEMFIELFCVLHVPISLLLCIWLTWPGATVLIGLPQKQRPSGSPDKLNQTPELLKPSKCNLRSALDRQMTGAHYIRARQTERALSLERTGFRITTAIPLWPAHIPQTYKTAQSTFILWEFVLRASFSLFFPKFWLTNPVFLSDFWQSQRCHSIQVFSFGNQKRRRAVGGHLWFM